MEALLEDVMVNEERDKHCMEVSAFRGKEVGGPVDLQNNVSFCPLRMR